VANGNGLANHRQLRRFGDLPVKAGSSTFPVPGYDVHVLDEDGKACSPNVSGNIAIKLPMPPGSFYTLWNNHTRFLETYLRRYPGYYLCGDGGYFDQDGYLFVMGRIDDVINVAGHRLSTGEMEEVVGSHSDVAECCVVAVEDNLKGEVPVAFVVLKDTAKDTPSVIEKAVVQLIRQEIGPLASLNTVCTIARAPKTRSGKILRATIRALTSHLPEKVPTPPTIDDPTVIAEIVDVLRKYRVGRYGTTPPVPKPK